MELKLYFSEEEMIDYLKKKGYTIEEVDSWYSQNEYHNRVEHYDCKVKIAYAYRERPSNTELEGDNYSINSKYGIENVFKNKIKKRILSI